MPKLTAQLSTVNVQRLGPASAWVIEWSASDGNRYHINLPADDKGRLATATEVEAHGCTMYKNPPHHITEGKLYHEYRRHPGFFEPRLLTPTARANRAMVNEVLHHAIGQDLYGRVIEAEAAADARAEAERQARAHQAALRELGPEAVAELRSRVARLETMFEAAHRCAGNGNPVPLAFVREWLGDQLTSDVLARDPAAN